MFLLCSNRTWMFTFCSRFVLAEKHETRTNGEQRKNARTYQEHMVNIMITPTQRKCPVHLYIYITTVIYLPKILGGSLNYKIKKPPFVLFYKRGVAIVIKKYQGVLNRCANTWEVRYAAIYLYRYNKINIIKS